MADTSQQVIIEFVSDTSQLAPAVDKLTALGTIDQKAATIFKQTNDQLKQRNELLQQSVQSTTAVTEGATDQQAIYNKLAASVKNLSGSSKEAVQNLLKLSAADFAKTFSSGSKSVDDYIAALENATGATDGLTKSSTTIRAQLRAVTNELATLTAAGKTEGEEFAVLASQAGRLKNALQDTQQTVSNLGSDVPVVKVFEAGVRGVTGAFTAATGAAAAFGDENKDLQEVLVKVNGVMAINAGISEILNVVRDESAISTARVLIQERLYAAQLVIENGLQSESVIVRSAATVAQYALNLAMSLSPIGIVVIALAAFVGGLALFISSATKAAIAQASLNATLESTGKILDAGIAGVNNANKVIISALDERNAKESELQEQDLRALKINNQQRLDAINELNAQISKNQENTNKDVQEKVKAARDQLEKLEQDYQDGKAEITAKGNALQKALIVEELQDEADLQQGRLSLAQKNSDAEFALQRKLAVAKAAIDIQAAGDDAAKVFAIQSQLARDIKDINIAQAAIAQKAIAANLNTALIQAQNQSRAINDRVSQEEIDRQKAAILEQAAFDVKQEGLTQQEIVNIRAKANQQVLELQRQFNTQSAIETLQDAIALNNKQLDQVNISAKKKLDIQIENVINEAAIEIEQNRGKSAIIQGIEADRDAKIKALRLQSIEDVNAQEIALNDAQNAAVIRQLQKTLDQQAALRNDNDYFSAKSLQKRQGFEKLDLNSQLAIIDQITQLQLQDDQKKLDSLQNELDQGLISQKEYNVKYAELQDDQAKIVEDGEKKKQDLISATTKKAQQSTQQIIDFALQNASKAVSILQTLYQQEDDAAEQNIQAQRDRIQALSDAGDITTKEAMARNTALDVQEKQLQYQQAKRDKEVALFNAIISGAEAVVKALPLGPVYAAIVGALAAAEIAVIASKPLPQFGIGKKGNYSGLAEVGETGPEFVRRGGRLYLEDRPTITWLGPSDKVYNPAETAAMMEARVPAAYFPGQGSAPAKVAGFDYDRMGKAVGANIPQTGIGFDEHGLFEWQRKKNSFTKYLNKRRSWR